MCVFVSVLFVELSAGVVVIRVRNPVVSAFCVHDLTVVCVSLRE